MIWWIKRWREGGCWLILKTFSLKNECLCNFLNFCVNSFHLRIVWFKAFNKYLKLSIERQGFKFWYEFLLNLVKDCLTLFSKVRTFCKKVQCNGGTSLYHSNPIHGCLNSILSVQLELKSKECLHICALHCNAFSSLVSYFQLILL